MWIRRRDVEVASWCLEIEFSLNRKEGEEAIGGVVLLKYLGRILDQAEDEWTLVRRNIRKARRVWGRLVVILRQEGADPTTSTKNFRSVVQVVLLFGADMWVLSVAMKKQIAGVHTVFLRHGTGKGERSQQDGTWWR